MRLLILKLHANNFEIEATFLKLHHAPLPIIHLVKAGRMALVLLHKQSCCQVSISAVSNFVAFRLVVSPFPSPPLSCFSFLLPDPARPCTFPICILMTFGLTCKLLREVKDLGSMVLAGTRMCRGPVYLDPFSGQICRSLPADAHTPRRTRQCHRHYPNPNPTPNRTDTNTH